jgi:RHS repeat-associated protein
VTVLDTVYLEGLPLADISGTGVVSYLHTDRLGTVQLATTSSGAVAWQGAYQPFGTVTAGQGLLAQNLRFPGQYADAKTGWYQNYNRDYDPAIGRYLEADPVGLNAGVNPYVYVWDEPVNYVDPTGLCPKTHKCPPMGQAPDPSSYENAGKMDHFMTSHGDPFDEAEDISEFRRGGNLDAQVQYGGSPAYANYAFGVYMSAVGFSLPATLGAADAYAAARSSYPPNTPMDPNYPSTPASNVQNISDGYNDQDKGNLCQP